MLREWWRVAGLRLGFAFALSGTVATIVPFVVLLVLNRPQGAVLAAFGGLNTILAAVGSDYRSRVFSMAVALVLGALSLWLGCLIPQAAWFGPAVLAAVMFAVGMTLVFGPMGKSAVVSAGVMFLVGFYSPEGTAHAAAYVGYFAIGGLCAMLVLVGVWRMRPYRYLFMQVATCYQGCSGLVDALATSLAGRDRGRAHERLRRRHGELRAAVRTAEASLEAVRIGAGHFNPLFDRAAVLLSAVSREATAAMSLRAVDWPAPGSPGARAWRRLLSVWSAILVAIATSLSSGQGEVDAAEVRAAYEALEAENALPEPARAPLRLALSQLDAVVQAGARFSNPHFVWSDTLPRLGLGGVRNAWDTLAAQLTLRSIIFRHALRVAAATGFALWIGGVLDLTHRLWLPLTVLVVLQPEFGATWQRLWQRVGGTLVGVLIAGAWVFWIQVPAIEIAIIALFAFGMFLFIRSHYGFGVVLLTPMVVLLLGVLDPQISGNLVVARGVDTLLGGVLALLAAFVLWPLWQRGAFIPQCATALRAYRDYLALAFALSGDGKLSHPDLTQARHLAERESDNADAILHRMLSEPRRTRGNVRAALGFMTWLRRLADDSVDFAVEVGGGKLAPDERKAGDEVLRRLDAVIAALAGGNTGEALPEIRPRLATELPSGGTLTPLFERLAEDSATLALGARKLRGSDASGAAAQAEAL